MAQDMEVEVNEKVETSESKKSPTTKENSVSPLKNLHNICILIEKSVSEKEFRIMSRAIRQFSLLRKILNSKILTDFINSVLTPEAESKSRLLSYINTVPNQEMDMDVTVDTKPPSLAWQNLHKSSSKPELEAFSNLAILVFLIDQKLYETAKECSSTAIKWLQQFNRRSLDALSAQLFYYYSLSYEKTDSLAEIRGTLLSLNRTASLRHDDAGQEMLLNLLLRNYLHYDLYDQAEKLRSKIQMPESRSNHQFCRYLFYLGRIRAIQLEYTEAKEYILQAGRKAPLVAHGFRITCTKWSVLVRLLLGEIPERTVFVVPGMKKALFPYFELTNAVRIGDLESFHKVAEKHSVIFTQDKTHNLIVRLRHNVIRTGLRRINVSYSKISLLDIAKKLHLDSPTPEDDAECIVAKAIRDGGIDAVIDHENKCVRSKETGDVYSSSEPISAFHSRIAFCLNTHNEAVKALRYPPNAHKKDLESGEKRRERQQQEQELARNIVEDDDDDEF